MQTDKNNMKVEQSVSIHSHALERPWKRQIVTDPKIAQHITNFNYTFIDLFNVKVPFFFFKKKKKVIFSRRPLYERCQKMFSVSLLYFDFLYLRRK